MRTSSNKGDFSLKHFLFVVFSTAIASAVLVAAYLTGQANYPLLHSGIELFSIVIACGIFTFVWSSRRHTSNSYFLLIGIAYLFVATIDALHMLAYKGVDIFGTNSFDIPTQLWLAARYLQAASLIIAPFLVGKKVDGRMLFVGYAAAFAFLTASIFSWNIFPTAFVDGSGLTQFKIISEYIISAGLLGGIFLLYRKRALFDRRVLKLLLASIAITVASELSFTLYADPFGFLNFSGHIFKVIAFYLAYRAIIITAINNPISLLDSNLKKSEEALRASEERLTRIIETNVDGIAIVDSNCVFTFANQSARNMLAIEEDDIGKKACSSRALQLSTPSGVPISDAERPIKQVLSSGEAVNGTILSLTKPDGESLIMSENAAPLHDETGKITGVVLSLRDITEQKKTEETLNHMAYYDTLTNLPNRTLLSDRLDMALAHSSRNGRMLGIMYIDLDNFKTVNETLGYTHGDELLTIAAERLKDCVRKSDTVARVGGDEFVLILSEIMSRRDITKIANKIIKAMEQPFNLSDNEFHISTSIGISLYPNDGISTQALLKNADAALYKAKERGKDTYAYYASDMNDKALERLSLENDLRKAVERNELVLYYQPLVDFTTNDVMSMEALIRWQHPKLGLIPPSDFIPMAEETGLIIPIGEWVLNEACKQNKEWQDAGYKPIRISVNASARQFQRNDLIGQIKKALSSSGLEAKYLEIEITESLLMQDKKSARKTLDTLKNMGVHIALDDFGTGYSSLSYLQNFPIGKLKIDQGFVRTLVSNPSDAAIVESIINMAHNLRLKAVAEGVETEDQFDILSALNCGEMQGYLYSCPLPASEAAQILSEEDSEEEQQSA